MLLASWQIIVLVIFAGISFLDGMSLMMGLYHNIVLVGLFTGLVVGDPHLGLVVGGSFQLLALGMAAIGGSSIPEYRSATILVIALASLNGGMSVAQQYIVTFGIPVAALTIQLDVVAKMCNSIFQGRIDKAIQDKDYKKIQRYNTLGAVSLFLGRAIPVAVGLIVGPSIVSILATYTPMWLVNGFKIAGGMLPIVGFVVLLKYLPTKENIHFVLLGFVLAAYLGLNTTGVAIIGVIIAMVIYKNSNNLNQQTANVGLADFEGDDYDE
ncbi:PTS sugar transporter subunit IIC [Clostridium sp. Marseille-Q2269]|uniref:PTS mannose/fructose/sorbose/N-acetylgalactosamine transporter subunit IIC n=1 Tax=Clostridium sp. Marseille-Q2269 TaxID=2942205 RepID=UPI0020735021|nr:PTS sugar transporter subunit IIC [Clostridium sp. Marseille-Q2269]